MKDRTTLIIIHPHFTIPGGAGKVVLELGKRISQKMDVVIIAQKINPEYIANYPEITFENLNGPITSSFTFWLLLTFWRKKTFQIIDKYKKKGKIKILCNAFPANWIGLPYKNTHPEVKCFWYCHEPSAFIHIKKWRNAITNPLKRLLANSLAPIFAIYDKKITIYADKIFANSHFSIDEIKNIYKKESIVIYPGVDLNSFRPIDYQEKENYILTVARLSKFKNIDILIHALSKIKDKKIQLRIVGDGEEKNNLINLAQKLDISNRVTILSGLNDEEVSNLFAKAKLFVLCSKNEPFGIVPVEALASGTPVIADNSGGPKEIINNGKNGLLIENMNAEKLANNITDLLSNKNTLRSFSFNARIGVSKIFTWENSVKNILEELNA